MAVRSLGAPWSFVCGDRSGLALVPKLKFEHEQSLSLFSKMRVDLAAQVCYYLLHTLCSSYWIGHFLFVLMFGKFFDAHNV